MHRSILTLSLSHAHLRASSVMRAVAHTCPQPKPQTPNLGEQHWQFEGRISSPHLELRKNRLRHPGRFVRVRGARARARVWMHARLLGYQRWGTHVQRTNTKMTNPSLPPLALPPATAVASPLQPPSWVPPWRHALVDARISVDTVEESGASAGPSCPDGGSGLSARQPRCVVLWLAPLRVCVA